MFLPIDVILDPYDCATVHGEVEQVAFTDAPNITGLVIPGAVTTSLKLPTIVLVAVKSAPCFWQEIEKSVSIIEPELL